jgi:prepilin-type N-terminal cleavage/methylation domain-containing protein
VPGDSGMRRHAFTLIELMVVISIIALLAAMLMAAIPEVRFNAKALKTTQRMEAVLQAFSRLGQQEGSACYIIQDKVIYPATGKGVVLFMPDPAGGMEQVAKTGSGTFFTPVDLAEKHFFGYPWGKS